MSKIIIHAEGFDVEEALEYVNLVVSNGKVSADGASYAYATTYTGMENVTVTTGVPNENGTTRFNVIRQEDQS